MRVVIQRVSESSVTIDGVVKSKIGTGLMVLVGIEEVDREADAEWLARKIVNMRIFPDEQGIMNKSLLDVGGEVLVISQFTLHASTKKGNRPSYIRAAKPETSIPLYERFVKIMEAELGQAVKTGEFGADMKVHLVNDGPVTITMDSQDRQ
ncbi:MAG: D-aminoacyl-tRNA deacylase [Ekhidna sp.]